MSRTNAKDCEGDLAAKADPTTPTPIKLLVNCTKHYYALTSYQRCIKPQMDG